MRNILNWKISFCSFILVLFIGNSISVLAQCGKTPCSNKMDWEITTPLTLNPNVSGDDFSVTISHSSSLSFRDNCSPYDLPNPLSNDPGLFSNPTYRIQIFKRNGSASFSYNLYQGFYCNLTNMDYTGALTGGQLIVNETFREVSPSATTFSTNNLAAGEYFYCVRLGTDKSHSKYKSGIFTITANHDFYITNAWVSSTIIPVSTSFSLSCYQRYSGNSTSALSVQMQYVLSTDTEFGNGDDIPLSNDYSSLYASNLSEYESTSPALSSSTPAGKYYLLFVADAPNNFGETNESNNVVAIEVEVVNKPPTPTNVQASDGTYCDRVRITWNAVNNATGYQVYRGTTYLGSTTSTSYDDFGASTSIETFKVRAYNGVGLSNFGNDNGYKGSIPNAPSNVIASDGTHKNLVKISWNTSIGATRYIILRNGTLIGNVSGNVTEVEDFKPTVQANTLYSYQVYAANDCGVSSVSSDAGYRCSDYSFSVTLQTNAPLIKTHKKNIVATIRNVGTEAFSGTLYLSWHKATDEYISDLDTEILTLNPGQEITLQSDNTPIISSQGHYKVFVKYQEPSGYGNCAALTTIVTQNVRVKGAVQRMYHPTATNGDPVNMLTGEYLWGHNDFLIKTIEGTIPFQRTYKSRAEYNRSFGKKWKHNFDIYLEIEPDIWTLHQGSGNEVHFVPNGRGGSQVRPTTNSDTLYFQSNNYFLEKKDGTTYRFYSDGRLLDITFSSGNQFSLSYIFGSLGKVNLEYIFFPKGRYLKFTYDSQNRIVQIQDNAGRITSYVYDSSDDLLLSAMNVRGGTVTYTYGQNANLTEIQDARGNSIVSNTYNSDNQVINQKDAYNKTTIIDYNTPINNATTFTNALGYKTIYYHDLYSRLTKVENHLGKSKVVAYDGFSYRPKVIADENGDSTQVFYDSHGNIIKMVNALGGQVDIVYNEDNYPTSYTNLFNHSLNIIYDSNNKPTKIDFPNNSSIQISYNNDGLPTLMTDQNNQNYSFLYNVYGDVQTVSTPTGNYVFQYDNAGKITSIKDRNSKTTLIQTDDYGNITKVTDPLGKSIVRVFNENGFIKEEQDKDGKSSFFEYDKRNLLVKIVDANNHETLFTYDDLGRIIKITDARNNHINYGYDELNRLINITNHFGSTTQTFGYDEVGNRLWTKDANGHGVTFTYNKLGQVLTVADELNNVDSLSYNKLGQLISYKNASLNNQFTRYSYDAMGWLASVTDPMNGSVNYTRDNLGNIININDANNKNTQITYNAQNFLQTIQYPGGTAFKRSFTYDNEGNVTSYTDEDGIITNFSYDDNNQIISINYSNGKSEAYGYDANGRVISASNDQGTISYTYDPVGNITKINDVFGQDIQYTYDKTYNRTSVTYPGGALSDPHTVSTSFNELNLPVQTSDWLGNFSKRFYTVNYQLDSIYNSNGSATKIVYDDLQRINRYVNRDGNGTIINQHLLTYDKNSHITEDKSILPSKPYFSVKLENYQRGDDGRLTQAGTRVFSNNNRGGRTTTIGSTAESFTWGETNLLTSYIKEGVTTTNRFDVFGNRIKKEKAGDQTRYLLDINNGLPKILQEQDNTGTVKASYIYTPNALGWRLDENNKASFYAFSFNGHTLGLTNEAGLLTDKYAYDLFGDHAKHTGTSSQPFTYLGKYGVVQESKGFYHIRARFYDASIGAFISKDAYPASATNTQSLNRYHYGFNDPLTFVDVDGLQASEVIGKVSPIHRKSFATKGKQSSFPVLSNKPQDIITLNMCFDLGRTRITHGQGTELNALMYPTSYENAKSFCEGLGGIQLALDIIGSMEPTPFADLTNTTLYLVCGKYTDAGLTLLGVIPIVGDAGKYVNKGLEIKNTLLRQGNEIISDVSNRFHHIFDNLDHKLDDFVKYFGSRGKAFDAVQEAANEAFKNGKLTPNANGILPFGDSGNIITVDGFKIQLIGGRIINGEVRISSFSRQIFNR